MQVTNERPRRCVNTVVLGLTPSGGAMEKTTNGGRPTVAQTLNVIRSILGHSAGREADALVEIQAAVNGATLEELAAIRDGH